jgi:hypothetical protein
MKRLLLLMSMILTISINAQTCFELFFSEYVEGWSQNKAIEIYNPTNTTVDLSNYQIERYSNGATNSSAGGITTLTGMLASGDAFVLTNGETDTGSTFGFCDPLLISLGDMAEPNGSYPTPMHMNGNDAMVLTKNGEIIDVIGKVGEDPASGAWTDDVASGFTMGSWWTAQHTLIRKNTVLYGDNIGTDSFNPSLEWDSLLVGTWNNLGSHSCDCISTWDCDGQGNCTDPGTGNGQYPTLSACESNCIVVAPTWDCDGQGNCTDPGTGQGTYASLTSCQSNCIQTSVDVKGIESVIIYPNPAKEKLNLYADATTISSYQIIDFLGRVVLSSNINNLNLVKVNISTLKSGVYLVKVQTPFGTAQRSIVIG